MVPFLGHERSMPAHDSVRRDDNGCDVLQSLATQNLTLHSEPSALVVVEHDSLFAKLLPQNLIFCAEIINRSLLLAVHDTGKYDQE